MVGCFQERRTGTSIAPPPPLTVVVDNARFFCFRAPVVGLARVLQETTAKNKLRDALKRRADRLKEDAARLEREVLSPLLPPN